MKSKPTSEWTLPKKALSHISFQKCNNFLPWEGRKGRGGVELTGVNWVPVDPATLQATKIACGERTCIIDVQFFSEEDQENER